MIIILHQRLSHHLASLLSLLVEAVAVVIVVPFRDKHLLILSLENHIVNFNTILSNLRMAYPGNSLVQANKPNKRLHSIWFRLNLHLNLTIIIQAHKIMHLLRAQLVITAKIHRLTTTQVKLPQNNIMLNRQPQQQPNNNR